MDRSRRRSVGAVLAVVSAAALTVLLATAAPSSALGVGTVSTGGDVLVSTDGVTWSSALAAGLFDDSLLAPGVPQNRTLYVLNDSSWTGVLEIDAVDASSTADGFLDNLRLSASSGSGASALQLATAVTCATVVSELTLAPHASTPVALALQLADSDTSHHGSTATVQLRVVLRQDGPAQPVACPTSSPWPGLAFSGPAELAATGPAGAAVMSLAVGAAGVGVLGGIALMASARRRETRRSRSDRRR